MQHGMNRLQYKKSHGAARCHVCHVYICGYKHGGSHGCGFWVAWPEELAGRRAPARSAARSAARSQPRASPSPIEPRVPATWTPCANSHRAVKNDTPHSQHIRQLLSHHSHLLRTVLPSHHACVATTDMQPSYLAPFPSIVLQNQVPASGKASAEDANPLP